jgi:replicative DNA helicase
MSELECGLLFACINNGEAFIEASSKLGIDSFTSKITQELWTTLIHLSKNGLPFDEPIIKSKLSDQGKEFFDNHVKWQAVDTSNYEFYITEVANQSKLQKLDDLGSIISGAVRGKASFHEVLNLAEQRILEIADESLGSDTRSIGEILSELTDKIKEGRKSGLSTTIESLDQMTNGLIPGQLIVIAGRPSMGKSAFAMQVAYYNALRNNVPFAVFSLEMSEEEVVERIIANIAEIESYKIRNGSLSDTDWTKLNAFIKDFKEAPLYIEDITSLDITTLRAKAKKVKMKHKNLGGLVIDYLQLMESGTGETNRVQAVSDISRGLKVLAKELQIPVIAVSQLNRSVEQRENKRPLLADLRESGAIEQDADVVIFLYSEDYYTGERGEESLLDLIVSKQRNGPIGVVKSVFKKNFQRIIGTTGT